MKHHSRKGKESKVSKMIRTTKLQNRLSKRLKKSKQRSSKSKKITEPSLKKLTNLN